MSKRKRDLFSLEFSDGVREALDKLREREKFPHPAAGEMINRLIKRAYCALECSDVIDAMNREKALDVWRGEETG